MQSWLIVPTHSGGRLQQIEQEQPQPGPGQVLVKIRAASLNHRDLYILEEFSAEDTDTPIVPLSDGAGEIVALGEESKRFQIGDRVVLPFFPSWLDGPPREDVILGRGEARTPGVLADYLTIGEQEALPLPGHLSYAEGATLPCAGVTAWNALATGQLRAGETVLLQGLGGVSVFGIQFAKATNARVIVLSRSEEKLARARSLGADETIHTPTTPRWDERVLALTDGRGVDHVLDVGGAETLPLSLRSVRLGGRINLIGGLGGFTGPVELSELRKRMAIVQTFYVGNRATFEAMNTFIEEHHLSPVIDRLFPFEQAPQAFEYLAGASHVGKVVIGW